MAGGRTGANDGRRHEKVRVCLREGEKSSMTVPGSQERSAVPASQERSAAPASQERSVTSIDQLMTVGYQYQIYFRRGNIGRGVSARHCTYARRLSSASTAYPTTSSRKVCTRCNVCNTCVTSKIFRLWQYIPSHSDEASEERSLAASQHRGWDAEAQHATLTGEGLAGSILPDEL